jgi:hypothetical protein
MSYNTIKEVMKNTNLYLHDNFKDDLKKLEKKNPELFHKMQGELDKLENFDQEALKKYLNSRNKKRIVCAKSDFFKYRDQLRKRGLHSRIMYMNVPDGMYLLSYITEHDRQDLVAQSMDDKTKLYDENGNIRGTLRTIVEDELNNEAPHPSEQSEDMQDDDANDLLKMGINLSFDALKFMASIGSSRVDKVAKKLQHADSDVWEELCEMLEKLGAIQERPQLIGLQDEKTPEPENKLRHSRIKEISKKNREPSAAAIERQKEKEEKAKLRLQRNMQRGEEKRKKQLADAAAREEKKKADADVEKFMRRAPLGCTALIAAAVIAAVAVPQIQNYSFRQNRVDLSVDDVDVADRVIRSQFTQNGGVTFTYRDFTIGYDGESFYQGLQCGDTCNRRNGGHESHVSWFVKLSNSEAKKILPANERKGIINAWNAQQATSTTGNSVGIEWYDENDDSIPHDEFTKNGVTINEKMECGSYTSFGYDGSSFYRSEMRQTSNLRETRVFLKISDAEVRQQITEDGLHTLLRNYAHMEAQRQGRPSPDQQEVVENLGFILPEQMQQMGIILEINSRQLGYDGTHFYTTTIVSGPDFPSLTAYRKLTDRQVDLLTNERDRKYAASLFKVHTSRGDITEDELNELLNVISEYWEQAQNREQDTNQTTR